MLRRLKELLFGGAALAGLIVLIWSFTGFNGDDLPDQNPVRDVQKVKSFPVPDSLTFAGERVPLENFDTRESFDRELNTNAYRHSSTILLIKRAHRYFQVIEPILREYGIPDDFKYLAVAESDLSNAVSPAKATGFWQFMSATGKEYGLEINKEVDERYHLEKSTEAACKYFLKSYKKYSNWTIVAASYNRGSNGVNRQIEIQGQTNYYNLLLPEETARYLFRILSYKTIFTDPEKYGFFIPGNQLYPEIEYRMVKIDTAVASFADFAHLVGTNYKILKSFNPWLRQPYLTNRAGKEYQIKVPLEGARTSAYNE
ncbi:MAG: lytic transglycosylase domain-containing protein [Bacteroidales bacterium]|nr:lytic transglycosylase domain-containing protein [Bacteroidales bacterium]